MSRFGWMSTVLILGCKDTQKENGDEGWKEKGEKLRDVSSTGRYAWHAWKQRHVELGMLGHFARYLYAVLAQHFWPWGGYFFFSFFRSVYIYLLALAAIFALDLDFLEGVILEVHSWGEMENKEVTGRIRDRRQDEIRIR